jgi:hypothetical protein
LNTFSYALNNPLQYSDPQGLAVPVVVVACLSNPSCAAAAAATVMVSGDIISSLLNEVFDDDDAESGSDDPKSCPTPNTDSSDFENIKKSKAKKNKKTGEIWEPDLLHKDHWEVYKDKKNWEKGKRSKSVWNDGRVKQYF